MLAFLNYQLENGLASRFDLNLLLQLLSDKRFTRTVLKVLPAFVENSSGRFRIWRSQIARTNQVFEHVIKMELSGSDLVVAWLDMLTRLELSKENRLILKRALSARQKSFSFQERAVLLRTLLAIIPSKQDITFQSNISFILQTTPFSIVEPLLPSFPSKPLPLILIEELIYKPFTPDSLLFMLYFACSDMSSPILLSTLKSRIQHGHITHSLFEQAVARSSSTTSPLLQCFLLVASWEIEREFASLEAWAVMQSPGFWEKWFESASQLCQRNANEFQNALMQLAESREVEGHLRILSLSLLNHCRNEVSESVAHSLRNHYHILPRSTIAWYCFILRDYKGDMEWVQEVDEFTSISLIASMNLPLRDWIALRSGHSQDLAVMAERCRLGIKSAPYWCCSFDAVGAEFAKQIAHKTTEGEILEIFERMRLIVSFCCSNKQYDGSDVYCLLFETVCLGDSIKSGKVLSPAEENRFYDRFDLLIPWMSKKGFEWMRSIEFLSCQSICTLSSSRKWKCLCYSEIYWTEEEISQVIETMKVQPDDFYNNLMLFRLCHRAGKLPYPASIDLSSNDPSMLALLLQLHPTDSAVLAALGNYAWKDVNPLVIPLPVRSFSRFFDVPDAVLTLLSLLSDPKSFDRFLTRSFPAAKPTEESFLLPSEKRRKADFESVMKHIEQLAANEASKQQCFSLEFPFLSPSNEFHFGLICLDVCAARCNELRSWRQFAPWIQAMLELMRSFDVANVLKKKKNKKVQAEAAVVERAVKVLVTFLNCILIDSKEDEDWSGLVGQIRNQGLGSKDLKDALECVESTFHYRR